MSIFRLVSLLLCSLCASCSKEFGQECQFGLPLDSKTNAESGLNSLSPYEVQMVKEALCKEKKLRAALSTSRPSILVSVQKLSKRKNASTANLPVNQFTGDVRFGERPTVRVTHQDIRWHHPFYSWPLAAYADMALLDPHHLNATNYGWKQVGKETFRNTPCIVYELTPFRVTGSWQFAGSVWVSSKDHLIVQFQGRYHPIRRNNPLHLREDFYYCFESTRKEIRPGVWVPDEIEMELPVNESDFVQPAFHAKAIFSWDANF